MEVQKTTLYNYHKNLGAKFVSFAGYEMPIQYSDGIIKEHISTRTHAGFFVSSTAPFILCKWKKPSLPSVCSGSRFKKS